MEDAHDARFWAMADRLVATGQIVIDRPRGTAHPRFPDIVYPLDYGYLAGTTGGDGDGIDIWRGSLPDLAVTAVIATIDLHKRDAEVKLLVGCAEGEARIALATHRTDSQAAILVFRPRNDSGD
jgi:inorganic pyrophosphatase